MSSNKLIQRLPRHLKMGELRVFLAVFEHRSFRKAAAVLHLTQPAITKAIAGLEDTLELRLFDRFAHGVEPTVHADSFAPRVVAIFDELRRAAQELARVASGSQGTLRVGVTEMPAIPFLPVAINRMVDVAPKIFVSVVEEGHPGLMDRLRKRDIEVAILRLSLVDPGEDMHVTRLFDEKLCVVASKQHPFAQRKRLSWPELLGERWVLPPADCYFYDHVQNTLGQAGLAMPRHVVETISVQLQFNMVLHGGLLGFGMRSQIDFAPGKDFLVRLPFDIDTPARAVAAVTLKAHAPSPLAQQLIGHIIAMAGAA
jgi:DNA-binding transcriptional LysR family regulator